MARGQAGFILGFTCPALLGIPLGCFRVSHTGLSPSSAELSSSFCYSYAIPHCGPATPRIRKDAGFRLIPVRSPLLGKSMSFSFPRVTEMFHFSRFRFSLPMNSVGDFTVLPVKGCPIRRSPDQSLFAAPRSISLLTTSFIALVYQVILHKPLVA